MTFGIKLLIKIRTVVPLSVNLVIYLIRRLEESDNNHEERKITTTRSDPLTNVEYKLVPTGMTFDVADLIRNIKMM